MNAEVIAIGDELTTGQRLDTNSQWISRELAVLGITTSFHTTVTDSLDAYAGCDRLLFGDCLNKFANQDNHLGFQNMKSFDPFRSGVG